MRGSGLRVLHVVASNQRRGGEVATSDLVTWLGTLGVDQRVVILRDAGEGRLQFGAPSAIVGGDPRLASLKIDLGALWRVRRGLSRWRPHVVQAQGSESFRHAVIVKWASGSRLVYRRIGAAWLGGGPRALAHRWLMGRADHVAAVAGAVAQETIDRFGVPSDRVSVIPVGVDESRIRAKMSRVAARSELGLPPKAPVILSLGALAWEKDPVGQLEAVATVLEEVPEARYIVAGDGELRTQVESLAAHRHLGDRVMTVGERLDVSELFAAADTLVLASRTEGLPGVIIEAGMAGIPAAAYAVGGISEVVREGETGLLASPGDRRGLTEALRKLVGDAALRRRLGTTARQRYRERYSIGVVAEAFLALYRELAAA